ncbi:hypothetical protein [Streptomyces achromogenes]|uniref:hypothetical protein n=1 Tax=Streptomyces achromogenes TaxID=67255 RepID=UPI003A800B7A
MSTLTPEQRGDLAEQMLPVAAHLTVLVHGDGGPEDVAEVLAGLDATQKDALLVVLAGLVDPEQPLKKALGWLDFTEHGSLTVPSSWSEQRSVRDLAPEPEVDLGDDFVDQAAVAKFVRGFRVEVTDADFLAAVQQCAALGMSCKDIDALRHWPAKTTENWLNKLRKRYQRAGREFPKLEFAKTARAFSEDEVVAIRERAEAGTSDVLLAVDYGVNRETIRTIVRGERYAEYGGPIRRARSRASLQASREYMCGHADNSQAGGFFWQKPVLTQRDREAIRERARNGEAVKDLAAEYQVSTQTIRTYAT